MAKETQKILASFFTSISKFSKLLETKKIDIILDSLIELDGIGETQINSINNFFFKFKLTKKLLKNLLMN